MLTKVSSGAASRPAETGVNIKCLGVKMFILTVRLRSLFFILLSFLFITSCASLNMGYERYYTGEFKSLTDVSLVVTLTESMVPSTSSWIDKIDNQQAKKTIRMGITFPSVRELRARAKII